MDFYPVTLMAYDVYALQHLYGKNMQYRKGDDTYIFYDTQKYNQVIWDAGGIDTIVYSGTTGGVIDLRPGAWQEVGQALRMWDKNGTELFRTKTVQILKGVTIENATGGGGNDKITGNSADNVLFGGAGNDLLYGEGGNDTLDGGTGIDTMYGGKGNDTYIIDDPADVAIEKANEGIDTIETPFTWVLSTHFENLTLTGLGDINGTGNAADNKLVGNSGANVLIGEAGNDTLDGGAGIDTLIGGVGNDTYVVDHPEDVIIENPGEGTDTVRSSINWTLAAELENLTLMGTAAIDGTGNAGNNILKGNAATNILRGGDGDDTLDGGAGKDVLIGGNGDDIYVVDNKGDVIIEDGESDIDTVKSSISWTLGRRLESLVLTGSKAINGTGNAAANTITGNKGNNVLDGGKGADMLVGGKGNDTYIVDNKGDRVVEAAGGGKDTVKSSVSYTLSANVENLILTGSKAINGTGNNLANKIVGNAKANTLKGGKGNDVLDGGKGRDTLIGGTGSDTYIVDNKKDKIIEAAKAGNDTVKSSVSWKLGANLENLVLTGAKAINGIGNSLSNVITGNKAANKLSGGAGHDTINGGKGNDTLNGGAGNDVLNGGAGKDKLTGGAGKDIFVFNTRLGDANIDILRDFSAKDDTIYLENAIFKKLKKTGTLSATNFTANAYGKALDKKDYIVYDTSSGKLYYDPDGSGAKEAVQFAVIGNHAKLTSADFVVV